MHFVLTGSPLSDGVHEAAWPLAAAATAADVPAAIVAAIAAGATELCFADGEVLLRAEVLDWLAAARTAGARRLHVWTDGRVLARPGAAQRLRAAGLSDAGVILFGADAAAHDYIAGSAGRFAAALKGLKAARKAGLRTGVVAPVLRPTYRELPSLVRRSLALGVARFEFVGGHGADRPKHGLLPHLEMAAPFVRAGVELATAAKRRARCWLIPHCLLEPPLDATNLPDLRAFSGLHLDPDARENGCHFRREQAAGCATCDLAACCRGPVATYLAQHGSGGIERR